MTRHTSPEITFVAEAGLRTFISYDNLSGDVTTLPDPFAQEDTPDLENLSMLNPIQMVFIQLILIMESFFRMVGIH